MSDELISYMVCNPKSSKIYDLIEASNIFSGFNSNELVVDNLDEMENKMAIINYAFCKYSQMKTVPQVFINKKVKLFALIITNFAAS